MLKKQLVKHPVGAPRWWERIAGAFRCRHGQDSVIRTAKLLSEKRPRTGDSFAQFLKQRKPIDKRAEASIGDSGGDTRGWGFAQFLKKRKPIDKRAKISIGDSGGDTRGWGAGEDIAMLNALKAFPKEVVLRWENIAAAVPGKTKACCVKMVASDA